MADWAYKPRYDARWDLPLPPTLITRLPGNKSIRRQQHPSALQTWDEEYWFNPTDHDTAKAIFLAKGALTAFTKLSWDVGGTPTQERSVYFASAWRVGRGGDALYQVSLAFELAG